MENKIDFKISKRYESVGELPNSETVKKELYKAQGKVVKIQASDLYPTNAYSFVRIKPDSFTEDSYVVQEPNNHEPTYYERTLKYSDLTDLMIPHNGVIFMSRDLRLDSNDQ